MDITGQLIMLMDEGKENKTGDATLAQKDLKTSLVREIKAHTKTASL